MVTKKDIRQLLKKGLTGWQAGLLVFEDSWLVDHGSDGFLSPEDIAAIKSGLRTPRDTEDYNTLIRLYRAVDYIDRQAFTFTAVAGLLLERVAGIGFTYYAHYMASLAMREFPLIVTEKQLASLKRSQKSFKLKRLHCLDQVVSLRAYELASEEQKAEAEYMEEAIEEWAPELYQQAQGEIQDLIKAGKLTPVRLPMLAREVWKLQPHQWRAEVEWWEGDPDWSEEKTSEMLQTGFSGRDLYKARLPEWTREVEKFDIFLTDEALWPTEDPPESLAIIQEPKGSQLDKSGFYKPNFMGHWPMAPLGARHGDPNHVGSIAVELAPAAREHIEKVLVRKQVLEEVSRIVGIDVASNVTEIMELFLEPSLGRYNMFAAYSAKDVPTALADLEAGRGSPAEDWRGGTIPDLPPIIMEKIKPPAAKVREIRAWISELLGDNWWKTSSRASEPEEEASHAS